MLNAFVIDPKTVRDISADVLDESGALRVLPASYWHKTSKEERALFGTRTGHYCLPTVELVDWFRTFIGNRSAVEIGAGPGVLCDALAIPGFDNYLQTRPEIAALYAATGQVSRYGAHVMKGDANEVVSDLRPDVVIGAWITHRFDEREPERGGNMFGPDVDALLADCAFYVMIGNAHVHRFHPLLERTPERVLTPSWLYSRAINGSPDFIGIWRGEK